MTQAFPLEPSLWSATATKAISTPPLDESISADVCVIGGGYAGLSTALHLAERGASVVVLEAKEPGFGGSGRNGGQVIPGLKYDPDELVGMFGQERGEKLVDFGSRTADAVFDLIDRHKMDVPRVRSGWIQGAHSPETVRTIQSRAEQWARRGAQVRTLDKAQTDEAIGNNQYLSSWFDARAGAIQPLSYARELARVAAGTGVRIFGETPATKLTRNGSKWTVNTAGGATVVADRVVIATNGYTGGLWPKLEQTVIATNSFQIATEPLSDNIRKSILPGGRVSSDARRLLFYFRFDHTGRLLLGGRGPFREPDGPQDWEHLQVMLDRLFPQVAGATIDFRWCGRVALTRDFLPHLHEPEPGLLIDIGCMGRGVGLQTAMGKAMADYVATGDSEALPLPPVPIKPLPFHFLQKAYLGAFIAWYRLLDRRGASAHV
jgi:glycine/D-amino acid oxidase-like deaminating enzyme